MKKKLRKYIILPLLAVLWLCGCGKKEETDKAETVPDTAAETESQTEETEETEEQQIAGYRTKCVGKNRYKR